MTTKLITPMLQAIAENLQAATTDAAKFDSGNQSAGTRVRIAMQAIKTAAQEIRVAVSEIKNK